MPMNHAGMNRRAKKKEKVEAMSKVVRKDMRLITRRLGSGRIPAPLHPLQSGAPPPRCGGRPRAAPGAVRPSVSASCRSPGESCRRVLPAGQAARSLRLVLAPCSPRLPIPGTSCYLASIRVLAASTASPGRAPPRHARPRGHDRGVAGRSCTWP